jgi:hypothetical protein
MGGVEEDAQVAGHVIEDVVEGLLVEGEADARGGEDVGVDAVEHGGRGVVGVGRSVEDGVDERLLVEDGSVAEVVVAQLRIDGMCGRVISIHGRVLLVDELECGDAVEDELGAKEQLLVEDGTTSESSSKGSRSKMGPSSPLYSSSKTDTATSGRNRITCSTTTLGHVGPNMCGSGHGASAHRLGHQSPRLCATPSSSGHRARWRNLDPRRWIDLEMKQERKSGRVGWGKLLNTERLTKANSSRCSMQM